MRSTNVYGSLLDVTSACSSHPALTCLVSVSFEEYQQIYSLQEFPYSVCLARQRIRYRRTTLCLVHALVLVFVRVPHHSCFQVHGICLGRHYVVVRSGSLEISETLSDVPCTIHPYYFTCMIMVSCRRRHSRVPRAC